MKFGGRLARNIDFEVASFQLLVKTCGKRRFLSYNLSKLKEVSHKMLVFRLSRVPLRVSGFAVSMGEAASHRMVSPFCIILCSFSRSDHISFIIPGYVEINFEHEV